MSREIVRFPFADSRTRILCLSALENFASPRLCVQLFCHTILIVNSSNI